jgi:hypothetical protein
LEKHTVSIFKAEVAMLGSGGIYTGLEEGRAEGVGNNIIIIILLTTVKTKNLTNIKHI